MRELFTRVFAIFWKDLLSELRTKEVATSVLVFALLVVVIFNFAFESGEDTIGLVAPGILWVAFTFAGVLGLNHTFATEKENSSLEGLMLCPVERYVIYLGKLAGSFTFMLVVAAIITPIFLVLFNLPLCLPRLALIIVLATVGFTSVGTLFSALSAHTKAREIMLPILFLPVVVPVLIAAVKATGVVLDGGAWSDMSTWLQILVAFDIIFLVVSVLVFEFVIEE
ncbi:MAG TPA: ABC transporter permease [Dehalococcoidia bacterium]|nr:ABC transporter permease [Dehalococcoidia bacterium]